jgi:DNA-binding NarL/FixJ family response regulator
LPDFTESIMIGLARTAFPVPRGPATPFHEAVIRSEVTPMISVLVVDDHSFIRAQVTGLLHGADGIEVVGECSDGAEVVSLAALVQPDVVLMDVRMPIVSGPTATRDLLASQPASRVVMLTASVSASVVEESAQAGAVGFLVKGDDPSRLIEAVRTVAAGGTAWPTDLRSA